MRWEEKARNTDRRMHVGRESIRGHSQNRGACVSVRQEAAGLWHVAGAAGREEAALATGRAVA